jgi:hypothetical protein
VRDACKDIYFKIISDYRHFLGLMSHGELEILN